ncbi:hypothetical protein O181_023006 [Austropuccinia psidii MF-1]|uniref:Uncharacterized protein n=1 Tax=Austropuccinia psidii MF-1 TaxID=1389203 RepID=A0A9Q3CIK3_9BASI|nr:hypothetical protein [Austropuccinia psidii MF-1]
MVDGRTLREIMNMLPFTFNSTGISKTEDWKDMDQALQFHQLLKDLFQWSIYNKTFNVELNWEEIGEGFQRIFLNEIPFQDLIEITEFWIPNRKLRLLEERAARIRENQATIQAIEEQLNQKEHTLTPSRSQRVKQIDYSVA